MAAISITAASVVGSGQPTKTAIAGAALAAGEFIYLDTADSNKAKLADANGTAALAVVAGCCLNSCAAGQPVTYAESGEITTQAAAFANVGMPLVLSQTAGKCGPVADLATSDRVSKIGWSTATNKFMLAIQNTGVVFA